MTMSSALSRPVFLVGFMACGKSTLGRALVQKMPGLRFVDLDEEVERRAGMSVSRIFAEQGEEAFRQLENDALRRCAGANAIIACGGGTPCRPENMAYMLENGLVIWLQASVDITVQRLLLAPGQRPKIDALLSQPEVLRTTIENMLAQRSCHYRRAHAVFDADRLDTAEQIDRTTDVFIQQFLI